MIRKPKYRPWVNGRYETTPGLKPIAADFGNGDFDQQLFQRDHSLERGIQNRAACYAERKDKYVQRAPGFEDHEPRLARAMAKLIGRELRSPNESLDDLALEVAEDFAIVQMSPEGGIITYLNLCAPSHWAPEEKIGKSFAPVHEGIPGMEKVNAAGDALLRQCVERGPFVRFVWGVESDDRLNHHPENGPGRDFRDGKLWVRTERQVLWPLDGDLLFTIRVGFWSMEELDEEPELWPPLIQAVRGMTPEQRAYKGLDRHWDTLLAILDQKTGTLGGT